MRELVGWIGAGRKLTQTGRITLADARTLVELLGTGDQMDPVIGDRRFKTKSSEELYHLNLLAEWAKAARLLRVAGGRLLPVKKNARLLDRPDGLWNALFEAVPRIGSAVLVSGWLESVFSQEYAAGLRTLLHRLYAARGPVAGDALRRAVWQAVTAPYILDDVPPERLWAWRGSNDRDVRLLLEALAALGAVRSDDDTVELTGQGRRAVAAEADRSYPVCVAGSGACPPEDCGGAGAYEDLKRTLADPTRTEHADLVRWLGLDSGVGFDPARFTPGEANDRLQQM
ncbi:hypothetical protein [Streptomyces sp. ISL-66]|uniref:IS1096 element passenger TnpR family protein n=1 Tax=Streptomyces sp. ISL-66 TaxID=2819186 RepID=UPI0027E54D07|nr:hypothetical protein [Streptomyces sp. ISL-66]